MGQGHGEKLSLPKKFSKSRGIAKKILIRKICLSPEAWSKSRSIVEKILSKNVSKSRGIGKKFHSKKNFICYQVTIIKQFIQFKIQSKSLGQRQHKQQRPYHVHIRKYYKSQSFVNEHISGNIRN